VRAGGMGGEALLRRGPLVEPPPTRHSNRLTSVFFGITISRNGMTPILRPARPRRCCCFSHRSCTFISSSASRGLLPSIDKPAQDANLRQDVSGRHPLRDAELIPASRARPSRSRSSPRTRSTTSSPRSRTRRVSPLTSNDSSSLESSSRMAEPFRTTTSRRSRPSTSCSDCEVVWPRRGRRRTT